MPTDENRRLDAETMRTSSRYVNFGNEFSKAPAHDPNSSFRKAEE